MEEPVETLAKIYALGPVDALCAGCREHAPTRVIILPPAVVRTRAPRPVHATAFRRVTDELDDLANATWEDAEWQ